MPPVWAVAPLLRLLDALPPRVQVRLSGRPPIVVDGQTLDPGAQLLLALRERLIPPTAEMPRSRSSAREPAMRRSRRAGEWPRWPPRMTSS